MSRHKFACLDDQGPDVCTCSDENVAKDVICCHRGAGWHRSDVISCELWDIEVEAYATPVRRNGYGYSDDEHPSYIKPLVLEGTIHRERELPSFAREVSRRYNESLWGKQPAPNVTIQAEPIIRRVGNALEERRILNGMILKQAWKDLFFNGSVFLVQLFVALFVGFNSHEPFGIFFCWALAVAWGMFAVGSVRTLIKQKRRVKNAGA